MKAHQVRAHRSDEALPRTEQLAWKLAQLAADTTALPSIDEDVVDMVVNRVIDDAAVATASRSEERRVGKECAIVCRSRWSPYH